jgi:hypothetical protein
VSSSRNVSLHLARSAAAGAALGCVALAVGVTRFLFGGGRSVGPLWIALLHAGIYVAAFAAAGVVVGLLFPLRHSRTGAAVVGAAAAIPCVAGTALILDRTDWTPATWTAIITASIVMGSLFGAVNLRTPRLLSVDEALPPVRLRTVAPPPAEPTHDEEQERT